MLKVEGLRKRYDGFALDDIRFSAGAGEYLVLLGESGTGKTLILEMIAGLVRPAGGQVWVDGTDCTYSPIQSRGIGLVYQDHALFPHMSVRRNIAYALPRRERGRAEELAASVGASALLDRAPATLSAGEAQRVALARTLARRPRVLMLDEPLASLDVRSRAAIRGLLRRLHAAGQTILHVTHNYEEAVALATRVAVLEDGRITQLGTPNEVFHHPRSRFVANFVGMRNFFHGEVRPCEGGGVVRFTTGGVDMWVAGPAPAGPACVVFSSADVTVYGARPCTSARNTFEGVITDIEPMPHGVGLDVDIGVELHALITRESLEELGLAPGARIWVGFKSTAIRFIAGAGE